MPTQYNNIGQKEGEENKNFERVLKFYQSITSGKNPDWRGGRNVSAKPTNYIPCEATISSPLLPEFEWMERDNSRSKFAVEHVPREFTGILDARLSPFVDTNVSVEYYDEYICIKYLDTLFKLRM